MTSATESTYCVGRATETATLYHSLANATVTRISACSTSRPLAADGYVERKIGKDKAVSSLRKRSMGRLEIKKKLSINNSHTFRMKLRQIYQIPE